MRKKRSFKVNRCYHLISRIAHRAYFFDEGEKDRFVNLIRRVEQFCGVRVLGYAVMSNHFHIYVYLEDEHPVRYNAEPVASFKVEKDLVL